ncbi:glycoside hydrolase family 3 C-terminal domain-containing protein [Georgenia sp. EYE_87]|uniref:glycoside hydrolase family 3 protein n=1 Tax=Georgenia sp. EYE_87 TaxID=2853448 RepID=UPI0020045644|nr:glycoside hydrolase family 3 N-terminal domain-containing protein [Georgenia sp. EYE_87]MCK6210841.1 glycoside hydrolase family 3 C-terminal domain-containing protein [Georgenia sp. EYE_87]
MGKHRTRANGRAAAAAAVALPLSLALAGGALAATPDHSSAGGNPPAHSNAGGKNAPEVEARVKPVIKKGQREFRDLNANGQVDTYEDWGKSPSQRAADLVSRMTLEEKAGLIHITSERRGAPAGTVVDDPYAPTVGYVEDRNIRYLVIRDNPTAAQLADRANDYQELAEASRLGIPVVFTSNPRNHVNPDQQFGISEATGQFSLWPGSLGLAASHDPGVVRGFAEIAREEWRAAGIHKIYGYQIETATEPRWNRVSGTFGESPELNADIARELVLGFQGEELDSESVAQTIKHFPGDGAVLRGLDPHNAQGQWAIYPTEGSLYDYQLPPFQAAIDAGASSVMSYYNVPSNELSADQLPKHLWYSEDQQFEEVAGAYNKAIIDGLLKGEMGFTGYVNSDSGILTTTAWGEAIQAMTLEERYAKAVDAGIALFSDYNDPTGLINAVNQGLLPESDLDPHVQSLLEEIFTLGLFENPYVDPANAQEIADSAESQAVADEAHRRSVTLLRNDAGQLPLTDEALAETRLYVEVFTRTNAANQTAALKNVIRAADPSVQIVDTPEEATDALVLVRPNSYELPDGSAKSVELDANTGVNVARIQEIEATVPTILAVNAVLPWVIEDIEPGAASVVATFDVKTEAIWEAVRGEFNPTGKLPVTLPADQAAVEANASDVPGYAEAFDYAYTNAAGDTYEFGFGLSYEE